MFRRMMFALLLAAPSAAAVGQGQEMGNWAIAQMPNGCMVEAVSPQGTMLSIWGFAGQPKLAFLLQNKGWNALHDGQSYKLGLDFVELGLVYEVEVDGGTVDVTFTLTSPGCPIGPQVTEQIEEFVGELDDVDEVTSTMVFAPPWTPDKMSEDAKFALGY